VLTANSALSALYKAGSYATSWAQKNEGSGAIMTVRWAGRLAVCTLAVVLWTAAARAELVVHIDKSSQRMSVSVDGATRYNWAISTGRDGYGTPTGTYHPQAMMRSYFSKKYYNAPMPHAIFFYYGFAIHGTNDISRLGGPASHGCVRLHPANAATLFALVQRSGPRNTTIEISN
jgi:lipoprotein-anchoring transpeptidase ErfK/SrfK